MQSDTKPTGLTTAWRRVLLHVQVGRHAGYCPKAVAAQHGHGTFLTCVVDQHIDACIRPVLGDDGWQRRHLCLLSDVTDHRQEVVRLHANLWGGDSLTQLLQLLPVYEM